jgi:hypothetical protein
MIEYDIYIPLMTGDGKPLSAITLEGIKETLLEGFGGFTEVTFNRPGAWKMGNTTFRDSVCILRALDSGSAFDLPEYKLQLARLLNQKEILIVKRHVEVL